MTNFRDVVEPADEQSITVISWAAASEETVLPLCLDQVRVCRTWCRKMFIPLQQIADRRQQASIAIDVFKGHVGVKTVASRGIRYGPVRSDTRVIITPRGMTHT